MVAALAAGPAPRGAAPMIAPLRARGRGCTGEVVVDRLDLSTFIFPAIVNRGDADGGDRHRAAPSPRCWRAASVSGSRHSSGAHRRVRRADATASRQCRGRA